MQQEPSQIKSDILLRVKALYLVFVLLVAVVLVRLVCVQFFSHEVRTNARRLSSRIFLPDTLYAQRGGILSRDGEPLALSIFRYQPLFDFDSEGFEDTETFLKQSDSLAQLLSAYFGDRTTEQYRNLLRSKQAKARATYRLSEEYDTTYYRDEGLFPLLVDLLMGRAKVTERVRDTIRSHRPTVILPRDVDYAEWEQLRRFPILNYNMGMTYTLAEYDRRIYPQGDLARRTIGRTTSNGHDYGLEMVYADYLAGEDGFSVRQRIARGFSTRVADAEHRPAIDGADVVTTLDLNLQDVADKALRRQLEAQNALWGTTLVMEVETGEILAMANLGRAADGSISERENYALSRSMEPGSTFKLATVLALLDDAGMSPDKVYETHNGDPVTVGQAQNIRDSHRGDREIALKRAVEGSSNVYFAKAVWEYYGQTRQRQRFSDYLHERLGLGETVGLEALGERAPKITTDWRVADPNIMLVKMAYGYRVQLTPIQILTFYNAIANGGRKIAPILVREIRRDGEVLERFESRTLREKICSDATLQVVRECLEAVAATGTAAGYLGDTLRLRAAAKTGTAQVTSGPAGGYLGSMVAYFPADKPRYTILTTIETRLQPGKAYYGASLAGPVVERVVDYIYGREPDWSNRLTEGGETYRPNRIKGGMVKPMERVADRLVDRVDADGKALWGRAAYDASDRLQITGIDTVADAVPDVVGMGLKDALFRLESCGIAVVVEGSGTVVWQSVPPQSNLSLPMTITIRLQ
ncbi:MAG: PASTA domain-containing protein [Alistipes sp.]|nr:PASTA domain-containing protein [Alistipes sp.]